MVSQVIFCLFFGKDVIYLMELWMVFFRLCFCGALVGDIGLCLFGVIFGMSGLGVLVFYSGIRISIFWLGVLSCGGQRGLFFL